MMKGSYFLTWANSSLAWHHPLTFRRWFCEGLEFPDDLEHSQLNGGFRKLVLLWLELQNAHRRSSCWIFSASKRKPLLLAAQFRSLCLKAEMRCFAPRVMQPSIATSMWWCADILPTIEFWERGLSTRSQYVQCRVAVQAVWIRQKRVLRFAKSIRPPVSRINEDFGRSSCCSE